MSVWCKGPASSACGYPVFPAPFVEETLLSPLKSWFPCQIIIDCICVGLFPGCLLCSIVYVSVFMPYSFDYYNFVIRFENRKCGNSSFVYSLSRLLWFFVVFVVPFEF